MGERMKTMSKKRAGQNEKRKRKLILLSHFCKEPPGVCVFAGQTAVVVRKPSVRNFNWGITAYALRKFYATYQTLWINKKKMQSSIWIAGSLFFVCLEYWYLKYFTWHWHHPLSVYSGCINFPIDHVWFVCFDARYLRSPCPSGIWGTSFPAGDRHITLFPLTWPSTWACWPNEQVIPAERSGTLFTSSRS